MKGAKVTLNFNVKDIQGMNKSLCKKATFAALDILAAESKKIVPLDQGPLKNSCAVDVNDDGSQGTVSYDTPYAIVQHENLHFMHQRGRQAKYLENPLNDAGVQSKMQQVAVGVFKGKY